jgi:mono/diheme cytochrome c family protein
MRSRAIRWICALALLSSLGSAIALAADPWNTGNPWHSGNPWNPQASVSPTGGPSSAFTPSASNSINGFGVSGNAAAGARIVMTKCAGCHGFDGSGNGTELIGLDVKQKPIPWTDRAAMSAMTDKLIAAKISQSQKSDPGSVMPSFQDQLTPDQINDVIAYIRNLSR